MRYLPSLIAMLLLVALPTPSLGQESPSARIKSYLATLGKAKTLNEVKPYFSKEFWSYTYAPLLDTSAKEQAQLLAETAKDLKGFVVKGETIKGNKASVSIADDKGQASPLPMVKENGVWVIDMEPVPDPGEDDDN